MDTRAKKDFPVTISDFKRIIQNCYFVDKSRFIASILDHPGINVTLITRPRRFGKTIILSMLKYFFTIDNAFENRTLFNDLEIERLGDKYMDRQGKSPVIFMSLKNINTDNFDDFIENLASLVATTYKNYDYLLDSQNLTTDDKEYFLKIKKRISNKTDLKNSLFSLTYFLTKHHNIYPILLIDEYDAPIITSWNEHYYDKCISFMRDFYGLVIKDNQYLDFAVLTGVTRISKESIFSGVNNFLPSSVLSNEYSDIFGFTEDEVIQLMKYYDAIDKFDELKTWYDGYRFGEVEIYNPWSVMNYLYQKCTPKSYWVNSSSNIILNSLLQNIDLTIADELKLLVSGESIERNIDESLVYGEINTNNNALFSILLSSGYLKFTSKSYLDDKWLCTLKIPNKEIISTYKSEILHRLYPKDDKLLNIMLKSMMSGDVSTFKMTFEKILSKNISYYDTAKDKAESFYHGFLLGLTILIDHLYVIKSNLESGKGRFDIGCFPKNKNNHGLILEFKISKNLNSLKKDSLKALKQINTNNYSALLDSFDIKNIIKYGISFYGTNIFITSSKI